MTEQAATALLMSTAAGMATMVGAMLAVLLRRPPKGLIALSFGMAAGVMVTLSLGELIPEATEVLSMLFPGKLGLWAALAAGLTGSLFAVLLSLLFCEGEERGRRQGDGVRAVAPRRKQADAWGYRRLGLLSMVAMLAHNLPEGIAVFLSGSADLHAGVLLCVAIALHNIPEGLAVAMPFCAAGEGRGKALWMAATAALAEPLGALLAWLFLAQHMGESSLALLYCGVAGLMTALAFGELLPAAFETKRNGWVLLGVMIGILAMGLALKLG